MERRTEIQRVILVVLDGLRPDAVDAFDLTNVRRLARLGPSTMSAQTVSPSLTWPALTSLLSGVPPEVHGILKDSIHLPKPKAKLSPLPGLLQQAGFPCSAFVEKIPSLYRAIAGRISRTLGFTEARFSGSTAAEVLFSAQGALQKQRRGLIYMHWAEADRTGHAHGWMSPQYGEAARRLDAALGMLVSSTNVETDPRTLLIAIADHGGGGLVPDHHVGDHPLNATIPLVMASGGLQHRQLPDVSLLDIPTTIAWALGVEAHPSYTGRVLAEAFAPVSQSAVA
jgi:predicted AlkP superfamily pyrophosphatase or phosphodiesterase